eukprot:364036-Chlamydomonas_euryale.AAC.6
MPPWQEWLMLCNPFKCAIGSQGALLIQQKMWKYCILKSQCNSRRDSRSVSRRCGSIASSKVSATVEGTVGV